MADSANGVEEPVVKAEPEDPLLESEVLPVIPKEFTVNGVHEESDCEDVGFFTQVEVDNTRKCLENTRLIIKDFETQLDWHLQQYMTLRNIFDPKKSKNGKDDGKRHDLLSISQLSAIIANHPEGNKKFIKRKGPISNGLGGRKRGRNKDSDSEEEDTDMSDEDSEDYEEDYTEEDSEGVDDPTEKKGKKSKGKKGRLSPEVKDEIVEEEHELIEPKEELETDEEMEMEELGMAMIEQIEEPAMKKSPPKRGKKSKETPPTPPKKGGRGKKAQKNSETVDLTNIKNCKVVLNRLDGAEVKDEELDKDELVELLKGKAITEFENFAIDDDKPIAILKSDNVKEFDFNECKTSNVVVTFESIENLPEFIFVRKVANNILNDMIKLVDADVFDQHLSEEKN